MKYAEASSVYSEYIRNNPYEGGMIVYDRDAGEYYVYSYETGRGVIASDSNRYELIDGATPRQRSRFLW